VEFDGSWEEGGSDFLVQCHGRVDQFLHVLLHLTGKTTARDVALKNAQVYCSQGLNLVGS
jgi:hypothetical protein